MSKGTLVMTAGAALLLIGFLREKGLEKANEILKEDAAKETEQDIKAALKDADMVFITAGFGAGTGTGATPVIAKIAKDMGILTVAVVSKPFSWEGQKRQERADQGIKELKEIVEVNVLSNDKLLQNVDRQVSIAEAFSIVDEVILQYIQNKIEKED